MMRKYNIIDEVKYTTKKGKRLKKYKVNVCMFKHIHRVDSYQTSGKSRGEVMIYDYLEDNMKIFDKEARTSFSETRRYDFIVEDVIIEFDGLQHFKSVSRYNNKISFKDRKDIDYFKTKVALANGMRFVRISYSQLNNIDKILDEVFESEDRLMLFGKEYEELTWVSKIKEEYKLAS